MMSTIALVICLMLDLGSKSILFTKKLAQKSKHWGGCKWFRKFFRSCPTIAIKVGEFHVMDRNRAPSFIRFILQRTFLLVLKTKLSVEYGKNLTVYLPTS